MASEWVWTNNYFNSVTGNLDSSSRSPSSGPVARLTTRWRYDELERARAEIAPDGRADSTVYDRAGNVAVHVTRNGDKLWSIYDALNRPVDRNSTAKSYAQTSPAVCRLGSGGPGPGTCYGTDMLPEYSLSSSGYQTFPSQLTIPAQTAHFTYDPATGQVQEGDNADAQVTRTYDASGAVKSETQRVRTVGSGVQSNTHVYAMTYGRDRNGRVTSIQLPTALQPRSTGGTVLGTNIQYGYDPNTGALATVRDALGHVTTAGYNARGERISLALPGASVTEGYDAEGQLMSSVGQSSAGIALRNTTFQYDARGKMLSMAGTTGWHETNSSIYSGLGYLVHNHSTSRDDASIQTFYSDEGFTMSPLADILSALTTTTYAYASGGGFVSNSGGSYTYTNRTTVFDALSGRLQSQTTGTRHDYFFYDRAGRTKYRSANAGATDHPVAEERASYYDAAGQLRATEFHSVSNDMALTAEDRNYRRVFEEYGYDALGRRVWVRARKDCDVPNASNVFLCRMGTVRRLIWDGSATLAEIQQPGGNTATTADMESDGALVSQQPWLGAYYDSNPFYGIALYAYGMNGTDHPVTVTRLFYQDRPIGNSVATIWEPFSVVPLWNAAGQLDNMVYTNGTQQFAPYTPARHHIIDFPHGRFAYYRNDVVAGSWHGSLLEDKHDASGLHDRRNRSYDPMTGRFTQEDPIGLAGGMNVYGFAGGDPVNFSDPSGLCPKDMGGNGATRTMSDCPEGSAGRRQYISGAVSTAPFSPLDLIPIGALASGVRGLLVGAVEEVAESAGAGVVANKVAGDAFRDKIADLFRQAGYGVRTEVAKKTPFGQRMIDIEVSRNGEVLGGIETKLGSGRYNAYQRAKDAALKLLHDYTVQVVR